MKTFLNANLSLRQRIILYRCLYTLNEMDFSYLLPIIFGTLTVILTLTGILIPEASIKAVSDVQWALYLACFGVSGICFLITAPPHLKKLLIMISRFFGK
jgi:predicted CDP-diglyceride synthetase/phosphatidate cytidylyltransferase